MNNQCPKGFICINNMNVLSIILLLVVCLYFFNRENNKILYDKIKDLNRETDSLKQSINSDNRSNDTRSKDLSYDNNYEVYDRDLEAIRDPLYPPLKRNFHIDSKLQLRDVRDRHEIPTNRVSRLGLPINIETRGPSEDYQQIGMLYKETVSDDSSNPGNNTDSAILPLYGKPTYRGSNKYLYYTASDKMNMVKIPLTYNNRDCSDDQGCEEINDGAQITVPSYNGQFKAKMYKFDKPRYIPYIV
jgi:hypothetical protein